MALLGVTVVESIHVHKLDFQAMITVFLLLLLYPLTAL